ncbi:MAG: hypothetical protein EZS28_012492 [Streblomastix strix]|uniref:Uncharacterized protein n=1 Tax=Streblomastix strix TaxID=222440 RepID=A0A5J4WB10_9EUKA|nr:MAG: hypothetical protein EZS28_012492 [Streblomastix strix]
MVRSSMRKAGINTYIYAGYRAKAAGMSSQYQNGQSIEQIAQHSRLSSKSGVIQKYYIKPIEHTSSTMRSSQPPLSQHSYSPHETMQTIPIFGPSQWSQSGNLQEANEANDPPKIREFRDRSKIKVPKRFQE